LATALRERLAKQISQHKLPGADRALSDVLTDQAADKFAFTCQQRWVRVENVGDNVQSDNPAGLLDALQPFLPEILSQ
jgi:hypothetical protein